MVDSEPLPVVVGPEDDARDEVLLYPDVGMNTETGSSLTPNLLPT